MRLAIRLVFEFQKKLKLTSSTDKARAALQKQVSCDTSTYNVLRKDQPFVFSLLDKALAPIGDQGLLKPVLYLFQFGQKDEDELDLFELVNPTEVDSLSIHFACQVIYCSPGLACRSWLVLVVSFFLC